MEYNSCGDPKLEPSDAHFSFKGQVTAYRDADSVVRKTGEEACPVLEADTSNRSLQICLLPVKEVVETHYDECRGGHSLQDWVACISLRDGVSREEYCNLK